MSCVELVRGFEMTWQPKSFFSFLKQRNMQRWVAFGKMRYYSVKTALDTLKPASNRPTLTRFWNKVILAEHECTTNLNAID